MIEDFCEFIAAIERDPEAKVHGVTDRDILMLRQHVASCKQCYDSSGRVVQKYKDTEPNINKMFNVN